MVLFVGLTAVALPLLAQTSSTAPATDRTFPPLLTDLTISPNDSRLVRAAKRTVAERRAFMATANGPIWHVDDSMVSHNLTTSSSGVAPLGSTSLGTKRPPPGYASSTTISTGSSGPSQTQLMQKKEALQQEQARMSDEYYQPYAGDVPEDVSEHRMTEIPAQINAIDRKLETMPPPPSPPPPQ
jgi:hypothetical protein